MTHSLNPELREPEPAIPHCLHCLRVIGAREHFCVHCGMPQSNYANVAPLEWIWSFGWVISRMLGGRPNGVMVSGAVLFALPAAGGLLWLAGFLVPASWGTRTLFNAFGSTPMLIMDGLYVLLLVRVLRRYLTTPARPARGAEEASELRECACCGESGPGDFDVCWSCGSSGTETANTEGARGSVISGAVTLEATDTWAPLDRTNLVVLLTTVILTLAWMYLLELPFFLAAVCAGTALAVNLRARREERDADAAPW